MILLTLTGDIPKLISSPRHAVLIDRSNTVTLKLCLVPQSAAVDSGTRHYTTQGPDPL